MNTPLKSLIVAIVVIAVGFGVYKVMSGSGDKPFSPIATTQQDGDNDRPIAPVEPVRADRADTPPANDTGTGVRTQVEERPESGEDYPQGVMGRVVDARNAPVVGARAYLFQGVGNNLFEMMMKMQRGAIDPPLASAETDSEGVFRLGVREVPQGKVFELRFTSDRHPDKVMPNITLFAEKWWDAGTIQLEQGVIVTGTVCAEVNGAPIAGASVTVQPVGQAFVAGATPGRDNGVEVLTDDYGRFRFENAPSGPATVSAAAESFARVTMPNQVLSLETPTNVDFLLPPGKSIAGIVTDADGNPIRSASIQAFAISAKTPLTLQTRTDAAGRFSVIGLVDGPYQLNVSAGGFVARQVKPVLAGSTDEVVVLESQKGAKVRVVARNNRRIDAFEVDVRRYFPEQITHGFLHGRPTERVRSGDLRDGWYEVKSLDPGQYVFEVRANGYAKAYSEPFEISADTEEPEREVVLSAGGKIRGQVVGNDGRPIAGAAVTTLPNYYEDNPVTAMFGALAPQKITQTGARTDANGRFELKPLTPDTYQLKIEHQDVVTTFLKDIVVEDDQTTDVPPIRVETGVIVHGTVLVDGMPAAQVRVTVTVAIDESLPPEQRNPGFSAQAVTDEQGGFVLPRRLPPGRYQATAARQGNPFLMVVDHNKTKQEFTVGSGMTEYPIHFQITSQ